MELDNLIITVFCAAADTLKAMPEYKHLRQRGPKPALDDSEVLTMEFVGEMLGISTDKGIYSYFRAHFRHFFPRLKTIHRTTFTRQASNLWACKERLWQMIVGAIPTHRDDTFFIVDSFPIPVCQFARAKRCRRFRGQAAFGHDELVRHTFYGFRCHMLIRWPGIITRLVLTPGNVHDLKALPDLVDGVQGLALGDRNYWAPELAEELKGQGLHLSAPFRQASRDPHPEYRSLTSHIRYRIESVFGQLVERYTAKKVWARDLWHFYNRLLRKITSHSLAAFINISMGNPPLKFENLVP